MSIIITLLYIVLVLSAFLLVGVVLLQKSKDGGMVAMGSGVGEALFGAHATSFLVKTTIVLGTVFLGTALALSFIRRNDIPNSVTSGRSGGGGAPVEQPQDY